MCKLYELCYTKKLYDPFVLGTFRKHAQFAEGTLGKSPNMLLFV